VISTDVDSDAAIGTLSYYRLTNKQKKKARTINIQTLLIANIIKWSALHTSRSTGQDE
jgi:hypothetical protein